jgi:hypothetical protein
MQMSTLYGANNRYLKLRFDLKRSVAAAVGFGMLSAAMAGPPSLTAAQIVEKNAAARGGLAAWRGVQALKITGKMDLGAPHVATQKEIEVAQRGSPTLRKSLADAGLRRDNAANPAAAGDAPPAKPVIIPFALDMKRPHKTRLEVQYDNQTAVQTFDGAQGWKYRPYIGQKAAVPLNPAELRAAASQPDLDGMLIDYAAKGYKVALEKVEPLDGQPQYRLRVTLKNGETRRVWLDAGTFLETRIDNKPTLVEGRFRAASTYFHDYRPVNKLLIPYVVETRVDGVSNAGRMLVDAVQINPTLDDSRFAKPL